MASIETVHKNHFHVSQTKEYTLSSLYQVYYGPSVRLNFN